MGHDQRFKNLLMDYPRASLALFAPQEAAGLPSDAVLRWVRQEQKVPRLGTGHRELDAPLLVEYPSGEREAIAFILEHEASARRFSIRRLLRYCLDLSELLRTERIVPVVLFLRGVPRTNELVFGTERTECLRFRYVEFAFAAQEAAHWAQSDNVVARLNLLNMRHRRSDRVHLYDRALEGLVRLDPDEERRRKYSGLARLLWTADPGGGNGAEATLCFRERSRREVGRDRVLGAAAAGSSRGGAGRRPGTRP